MRWVYECFDLDLVFGNGNGSKKILPRGKDGGREGR
jgi:hypothetical protein